MKREVERFAAYIGIDWGNDKHDVCLRAAGSDELEQGTIEHTPEQLEQWVKAMRKRFGRKPFAVCLETARGPLVSALLKHKQFVVFPVPGASGVLAPRLPAAFGEDRGRFKSAQAMQCYGAWHR